MMVLGNSTKGITHSVRFPPHPHQHQTNQQSQPKSAANISHAQQCPLFALLRHPLHHPAPRISPHTRLLSNPQLARGKLLTSAIRSHGQAWADAHRLWCRGAGHTAAARS